MASTWRRLVADGRRLGRQWLQGKLSEETATRLPQLVVESGAASSSRALRFYLRCLTGLLLCLDVCGVSPCFCFFFVFALHLQRFVCFSLAYQLYFRNNFMLQLGF